MWVSSLLTGLLFLTEEQNEEAEGAIKPTTTVAEEDEKDRSERDTGEGKNSNKDSGKMLESFTFPSPTPTPHNPFFTHPPPSLLKAFIHFKLSEYPHYYSLHVISISSLPLTYF